MLSFRHSFNTEDTKRFLSTQRGSLRRPLTDHSPQRGRPKVGRASPQYRNTRQGGAHPSVSQPVATRPALLLSSQPPGAVPRAGGRPPAPRRGPAAGPAPPSPPAPLTQSREGGGENGGRGARRGCARCCLASPHLRRCPPGERHQRGVLGVMRRPWLGLVESSACSCWSGVKQTRTCAGMLFLHPLISHRCT